MTLSELLASCEHDTPPASLSLAIKALWHDACDDWNLAHECAQEDNSRDGSWVHAYLHRKEGDEANAAYWYRRAEQPIASDTLQQEWERIASELLQEE